MMQICSTSEWLSHESLVYIAQCLRCCENPAMVADLRQIFPKEALTEASKLVHPAQRKRLYQWVAYLNNQRAAA